MTKAKIPIIEDDEDVQELLKFNLLREGYETLSAFTGEECLKLAKAEKPNLILLDLMPLGIDGLEICRFIKGDFF